MAKTCWARTVGRLWSDRSELDLTDGPRRRNSFPVPAGNGPPAHLAPATDEEIGKVPKRRQAARRGAGWTTSHMVTPSSSASSTPYRGRTWETHRNDTAAT